MAGTKRERKLRRIERREERDASKVMAALAGLGEVRKQGYCEKYGFIGQIDPGEHGLLGGCIHCEHRMPHGEGCKIFGTHWDQVLERMTYPEEHFKNWEFDKWKQRTRKQKRSCVV